MRLTRPSSTVSGVSPGWMILTVSPRVQADADTSKVGERVCDQSPAASLSSIRRSAVAASGTRSSASASTIRASPSRVESE
jgi:hypothetical protein